MLRTALYISLILAPGAVSAPAANAQSATWGSDDSQREVVVSVRDIDFRRPEAVETAYKRLQAASKVACDTTEALPAYREADSRACEREAIEGAVHDLNQPLLTALDSRVHAPLVTEREQRR